MKKLKETKGGKIIKGVLEGALDVLPLPTMFKTWLDTDKDGKITVKDFKNMNWMGLGGAVAMLAILLKLEIVNFNQVIELIKVLTGG